MTRFQTFNPVDTLFYVYDQAVRRVGLPGSYIQVHLRLGGRLDVDGLKRAIAALHRIYPATASRLECGSITGRPRWRLDAPVPDMDRVLRFHPLRPATETELERQTHILLESPIDAVSLPPLQFHLYRGLPTGDVLVLCWPHYFMDASGVDLVLEDLRDLYDAGSKPDELTTKGDERRTDFADLMSSVSPAEKARLLARSGEDAPPPRWRDAWLPSEPMARPWGRVRFLSHFLDDEQTRQVREVATRMCGFARFAAFLRASALRALHRVMPHALRPNEGYSTLNLIDYRPRRQRGPVCHNFFGGIPSYVPANLVTDRKAVAYLLAKETRRARKDGGVLRTQITNDLLSKLPTSLLIEALAGALRPGIDSPLPHGFGKPPTLQLGFMAPLRQPNQRFFGASLENFYGYGFPPPRSGFAVDVNLSLGKLHITATYYDSRVPTETMQALVDDFVTALTDPNGS